MSDKQHAAHDSHDALTHVPAFKKPEHEDAAAQLPDSALNDARAAALAHMDSVMREQTLTQWQQQQGNAFVQRTLNVQRQTPAPAPAVTPLPAPGTDKPPATLPTFSGKYLFSGPNFNAEYIPVAPLPSVGTLKVTHKVFIDFQPFDTVKNEEPYKNMRFTKAQKADFAWTKAEETTFAADFISSVHKGWSDKHKLHLKDPAFSEYRALVDVNVVQVKGEGDAHTKIKALKTPKGAPRYRSFVKRGEHTAMLDIHDPSDPEKQKIRDRQLVRQVKPFGLDSADTTPVESQLSEIAGELKKMAPASAKPSAPLGDDWIVFFRGRASAKGSKAHNEKLAQQRADAVKARINALMGWSGVGSAASVGERNAADSEEFRRVDVAVSSKNEREVEQNTAAHEFGHMIGFDDEYVEEDPGKDGPKAKFFGDEPDHYDKIKSLMGEDAAKETLMQNSANIMSVGGDVKRGHYVFFLEAINGMTSKTWAVE